MHDDDQEADSQDAAECPAHSGPEVLTFKGRMVSYAQFDFHTSLRANRTLAAEVTSGVPDPEDHTHATTVALLCLPFMDVVALTSYLIRRTRMELAFSNVELYCHALCQAGRLERGSCDQGALLFSTVLREGRLVTPWFPPGIVSIRSGLVGRCSSVLYLGGSACDFLGVQGIPDHPGVGEPAGFICRVLHGLGECNPESWEAFPFPTRAVMVDRSNPFTLHGHPAGVLASGDSLVVNGLTCKVGRFHDPDPLRVPRMWATTAQIAPVVRSE